MSPSDPKPTPATDWKSVLVSFRWPLVVVALGIIAYGVYRETLHQAERAAGAVGEAAAVVAERAGELARNFLTADVTELFVAAIPEIGSTAGGSLELATAEVTEIFTRTDERRVLWDYFSLGTTVTEIKVPVTYRYHLRLHDPWRLEASGQICVVYAPRVRPTQPPAIHTDRMTKRVEEGWLRFDATEQLLDLERSLTPRLSARAAGPRYLDLVREESRRTVGEFVRDWLWREGQWREDRFRAIRVVFPDEAGQELEGLEVTLEIDPKD